MNKKWLIVALLCGLCVAVVGGQERTSEEPSETKPTPPLKPVIFVPSGATLLTELQLTKGDLLPVVAQVFGYFSLQHAGGQVIQGEQLRDLITSLDALWLVEYEFRQKGATPGDLVQLNQSLLEAQGWRRVFWNRSSDGNRETMLMVEPPRKGIFVLIARLNNTTNAIRVVAIRAQGEVDVGTTLWLLTTFLMRPEAPASPPAPTPEKLPAVKPTPEKSPPEKSPEESTEKAEGDKKAGEEKKPTPDEQKQ